MWKIFRLNYLQIFLSFISGFTGCLIILLALSLFFTIRPIYQSNTSPNLFTITKKVSIFQTLKQKRPFFKEREIEELKNQSFIEEYAVYIPSSFRVYLKVEKDFMAFSTDLFFEGLPDKFVNIENKELWKWNKKDSIVPIVIPRQWIQIYNFGFAESQDLPVLSEKTINQVVFNINLGDGLFRHKIKAKIVGFSDELNTCLAPIDFINWANDIFGSTKKFNPYKILLKVNNPTKPEFIEFIESKKYEINRDKIKPSRMAFIISVILTAILFIGSLITVLALVILVLSNNLFLQKHKNNITNLFYLGYNISQLSRFFNILSIFFALGIFILNMILIPVIENKIIQKFSVLQNESLTGDFNYCLWSAVLACFIALVSIISNRISIIKIVKIAVK